MKVSPTKLELSEAAYVLWLVCASWLNSEVPKVESTVLIHNVRRMYTRRDFYNEKKFNLPLIDQSINSKIQKLLSSQVIS